MTDPRHENLVDALYALQQEVGELPRDSANPFFSSHFSSFPAIKAKVDPIAWEHGLFVKQALSFDGNEDTLLNTLYFNSQPAEATTVRMHLQSVSPQGHGSATTFYRRYAYTTCLGLVSESDDDDGNASSLPATVRRDPPAASGRGGTAGSATPASLPSVPGEQTVMEDF